MGILFSNCLRTKFQVVINFHIQSFAGYIQNWLHKFESNKFVNSDGQWLLSFYKIVTYLAADQKLRVIICTPLMFLDVKKEKYFF